MKESKNKLWRVFLVLGLLLVAGLLSVLLYKPVEQSVQSVVSGNTAKASGAHQESVHTVLGSVSRSTVITSSGASIPVKNNSSVPSPDTGIGNAGQVISGAIVDSSTPVTVSTGPVNNNNISSSAALAYTNRSELFYSDIGSSLILKETSAPGEVDYCENDQTHATAVVNLSKYSKYSGDTLKVHSYYDSSATQLSEVDSKVVAAVNQSFKLSLKTYVHNGKVYTVPGEYLFMGYDVSATGAKTLLFELSANIYEKGFFK